MIQSQFPATKPIPADTPWREAVASVWRHRRLAAGFFLSVLLLTVAVTIVMPKSYRSQAKLFLRLGRETTTLDPTAMSNPESPTPLPSYESRESELNSAVEVLQSRGILEKIVDELSPEVVLGDAPLPSAPAAPRDTSGGGESSAKSLGWVAQARQWTGFTALRPRDMALRTLAGNLNVSPVRRSNIIVVEYAAPSPETAQAVTARIVDLYRTEHLRLNRAEKAPEFLAGETARLRADLAAAEAKLRDLKNSTGVASLEAQRQILVGQIGALEDSLRKTRSLSASSQAKVRELEASLRKLPAEEVSAQVAGKTREGTENMHGQLYALKLREQQYAAKYQETHPLLIDLRRQVAEAEQILAREERVHKEVTTSPGRGYQQVEAVLLAERPVLAALEAEAAALEKQHTDLQARLKEVNESEMQIAGLQREIQLMETNYKRYAANLEQARIDQSLESQRISGVSVVQPATFELRPVRPRPMVNLALGLAGGILGALGLAFAAEFFARTLNSPADVERHLDLPVLASLPRWKEKREVGTHARP